MNQRCDHKWKWEDIDKPYASGNILICSKCGISLNEEIKFLEQIKHINGYRRNYGYKEI